MDYIVGVDPGYRLELCVSCWEKMMPNEAVVLRTGAEGDPGPYHIRCFEDTFKLTVPVVMGHVHVSAARSGAMSS